MRDPVTVITSGSPLVAAGLAAEAPGAPAWPPTGDTAALDESVGVVVSVVAGGPAGIATVWPRPAPLHSALVPTSSVARTRFNLVMAIPSQNVAFAIR